MHFPLASNQVKTVLDRWYNWQARFHSIPKVISPYGTRNTMKLGWPPHTVTNYGWDLHQMLTLWAIKQTSAVQEQQLLGSYMMNIFLNISNSLIFWVLVLMFRVWKQLTCFNSHLMSQEASGILKHATKENGYLELTGWEYPCSNVSRNPTQKCLTSMGLVFGCPHTFAHIVLSEISVMAVQYSQFCQTDELNLFWGL